MRKIEQDMVTAIKAGESKNLGNTTVVTRTREDGVMVCTVKLHGNVIAQRSATGWGFKLAGWNTPTTRSRINAICSAEGIPYRVTTKRGQAYYGDRTVDDFEWF